jgi:hypothetical protein
LWSTILVALAGILLLGGFIAAGRDPAVKELLRRLARQLAGEPPTALAAKAPAA